MDIHFISTLTPEDEDRYAPHVLQAVRALLDLVPISYAVRITTANHQVFHHTRAEPAVSDLPPSDPLPFYGGRPPSLS